MGCRKVVGVIKIDKMFIEQILVVIFIVFLVKCYKMLIVKSKVIFILEVFLVFVFIWVFYRVGVLVYGLVFKF